MWRGESIASMTLQRSIEKNTPKIYFSIFTHRLLLASFLMPSQRHFLFPEEMDGQIDFLSVHGLFLGIQPPKNIKKSDA